ncbi:L-rhamnose mutarotase [Aquirufa rosea]|uniref:L-rhamnose mutarotase n=1 Tax=Aquirufa rosea TaxID=2509241 RepID=A0A4Q1BXV1_9BACT|nr:L-rhamnose mutarotase [Aquirufa rosea]RXK47511.1 L-rhamnose mutarotase [Aquirufa rosea]
MQRKALKMFLHPGKEAEYKKRHDEIWPELASLLTSTGVQNYSIFLDEETHILFAYLEAEDLTKLDDLPNHPIMQNWWAYMADIMESNPDNSPKSVEIPSVFYLA